MKPLSLLTSLMAIALLAVPALASKGHARIDVVANKGELKITQLKDSAVRVTHAGWYKTEQENKRFVTSDIPVSDDKWTQMVVEVTPTVDGNVRIFLRGQWDKKLKNWVYFDDVSVEGATLKNGSFEKKDGWYCPNKLVSDESLARTGKNAVRVWHDGSANQMLTVKAGVPVKVTAWVKFDTTEKKDPKPVK